MLQYRFMFSNYNTVSCLTINDGLNIYLYLVSTHRFTHQVRYQMAAIRTSDICNHNSGEIPEVLSA